MSLSASLAKLERQSFGDVLKQERKQLGLSHHDLSCRVGVSKSAIKLWEDGEGYPDRFEMKKLIGSIRKLRQFIHLLPTSTQNEVERDMMAAGDVIPTQLAPIAPPPPSFHTFGEALRHERLSEGLGQDELGDLVGVSGQAVSAWENDIANPIVSHYEALILLMPALRTAPKPESRNIEKPNGGAGQEKPRPTEEEPAMNRSPVVRNIPAAPSSERSSDFKSALIQWGRLVHALKSHPDVHLLTEFLAEANAAGMTLPEAMAALADPK